MLAGVNGTDPFMLRDHFLGQLAAMGFSGIQNFPTVGLIDGTFRQGLEETGMGYGLEIELVRAARQQDLLTTPYVFEPAQAAAMAEAGADILVPHMGLTTGGDIGAVDRAQARGLPGADRRHGRGGTGRAAGRPGAVPWRPDRDAGRRDLRPAPHPTLPRLLRRLVDGAPADRAGADRDHAHLQGDLPSRPARETACPRPMPAPS